MKFRRWLPFLLIAVILIFAGLYLWVPKVIIGSDRANQLHEPGSIHREMIDLADNFALKGVQCQGDDKAQAIIYSSLANFFLPFHEATAGRRKAYRSHFQRAINLNKPVPMPWTTPPGAPAIPYKTGESLRPRFREVSPES
ncbi:MAG: hypothetical protein P1V20_31815 [Verrucomicrobiales bacterium]|nr:hypothetical protein [Verrucomicrobiales bacterium]